MFSESKPPTYRYTSSLPSKDYSFKPFDTFHFCTFSSNNISEEFRNSTADDIFGSLTENFSFLCLSSQCRPECQACDQCQYALNQIIHLASGRKTEMLCPKMEECSLECIKKDINRVISCTQKNCNIFCFDGDCKQCRSIAKLVFREICRKHNILKLPRVNYTGTCFDLFENASNIYVNRKLHLLI
uniref:Uncharacterized protein n=1 Tax=Syphacia muris TaxID=451379 RepID=A0A0N5ANY4_9BILA